MNTRLSKASHRVLATVALAAAVAASPACGGAEESPFAKGSTPPPEPGAQPPGGNAQPGTNNPPAATPDAGGTPGFGQPVGGGIGCNTKPTRYVVLGHSVAHCFAVGGINSETCASKAVQTGLATRFPGITYENYAVDGALIEQVVTSQLKRVEGGPGHVFVNLYIGGNDLAAHMYESDTQAQKSWDTLRPKAAKDFEAIFAYFDDKAKFPDGATIMASSQYNPFDECVAGSYAFVTAKKQGFVIEFNEELRKVVSGHKNGAMVDQYTTFLGHGHHFSRSTCPKYIAGAEGWMADLIHPNEKGHVNLIREMNATVASMYKCD